MVLVKKYNYVQKRRIVELKRLVIRRLQTNDNSMLMF